MQFEEPRPTYRDPDSFDVRGAFQELAGSARRHKFLVIASGLSCLGLAIAYVSLFPPIYVVKSRVMVEKALDTSRDSFYATVNIFRKDDPRTEIELMTAPALVAEVVKREGLKYDDVYHPLSTHASRMFKASWPGRTYKKIKDSFFPKPVDPEAPTAAEIELGETVTDLIAGIRVTPVADSSIGEITVNGPTRRVAKVTNTLINTYLEQRADRFRSEAQRNLEALDKEVIAAADEASEIADKRLGFLQTSSLSFDLGKEAQQLVKLVELEDQIASNRAKRGSVQASLTLVEAQLAREPVTQTSSTTMELNTIREAAKIKRLDLETGLITLGSIYLEDSPEVKEVKKSIAELDRIIAREPERVQKIAIDTLNSSRQDLLLSRNTLRSQFEGLEGGLAVMENTQRTLHDRIRQVPGLQNQLRQFDRQYAFANDRYLALAAKRAQAAVSKAMAGAAMPSMQVVQWAAAPPDPAWPKPKILYPTALLFGLMLGVVAAQIRMLTSGRVSRASLESGGGESKIYGRIRIPIGETPFSVAGSRPSSGVRNER